MVCSQKRRCQMSDSRCLTRPWRQRRLVGSAHPTTATTLKLWVEMPQANAGVGGGETPLHFGPFAISGLSPGQQLGVELFWPIDPSIQTLPRQHAELNLGNVQPASMLGRVM